MNFLVRHSGYRAGYCELDDAIGGTNDHQVSFGRMPVAPHIARLRERVGTDLLLLPSVAVLPIDDRGRVLLVRQTDFGTYGMVGGAIDEDESPAEAAVREAAEEISVDVEITGLLGAIGGPQFRVTYPNGDQCTYVSIVYSATLPRAAQLTPDGDEIDRIRWFARDELIEPTVGGVRAQYVQST